MSHAQMNVRKFSVRNSKGTRYTRPTIVRPRSGDIKLAKLFKPWFTGMMSSIELVRKVYPKTWKRHSSAYVAGAVYRVAGAFRRTFAYQLGSKRSGKR